MIRALACTAALLLAASGCHRRRTVCAGVVGAAVARAMQSKLAGEAGPKMSPATHDRLAQLLGGVTPGLTAAMTDACTDDDWSRAELDCLRAAKTSRAVWDCDRFLSAAQRTKLTQRMASAVGTGSADADTAGSAGDVGAP